MATAYFVSIESVISFTKVAAGGPFEGGISAFRKGEERIGRANVCAGLFAGRHRTPSKLSSELCWSVDLSKTRTVLGPGTPVKTHASARAGDAFDAVEFAPRSFISEFRGCGRLILPYEFVSWEPSPFLLGFCSDSLDTFAPRFCPRAACGLYAKVFVGWKIYVLRGLESGRGFLRSGDFDGECSSRPILAFFWKLFNI